nr:hypothetical protein 4 [bacterium]
MLSKVSFAIPQYQQKPAFKGAKEIEEIIKIAKGIKQNGHDVTSLNSKLNRLLGKNKITKQDIGEASKSELLEDWIAKILAGKAKI